MTGVQPASEFCRGNLERTERMREAGYDVVIRRLVAQNEDIGPAIACRCVDALAAIEPVVASSTLETVVRRIAFQAVLAVAAIEADCATQR